MKQPDRQVTPSLARPTIWERLAVPFSGISAASFAALSAMRRDRFFHPTGDAYSGTVVIDPTSAAAFGLEALAGNHDAIVRFSRGAGVPEPLPDVLGLAIKLRNVAAPGSDQDLLLASSASPVGARHLLLPSRSFLSCIYSTVLPYRTVVGDLLIGARAEPGFGPRKGDLSDLEDAALRGDLRFELIAARVTGPWEPIGTLDVGGRYTPETADELRFNPWNTHPDLRPAGPLNQLRRSTYKASQEARPTT